MNTNENEHEQRPITPAVDVWIHHDHKFMKCSSTRDPNAEPLWQTLFISAFIAGLTWAMYLFI